KSMLPYPPHMPDAIVETYKIIDSIELRIWRFEPKEHRSNNQRPAIVFFFGGGFRMGSPQQFEPQAKHLAARGMVALTADYRVSERHQVKAYQCVEDAKAAMRWVRENAGRLGIDPDRIAAAGGSAGGVLAAATGIVPGFNGAQIDTLTSAIPNAMILFNPGLVLAPFDGYELSSERMQSLVERVGVPPETLSPYHHIKPDLPPTIIFHGQADETIAYETAAHFTEKMKSYGNRCELVGYEGEEHGFFNYGRGDGSAYTDTVRRMDEFLVSLGWLR
ncbi:MAG: alpha/beta hydrolase, partial [Chloroflexota bacterium]